jgi:hypothetical protein
MALSAPPNYQQEVKEIPLYGDINSEEETPKSIPRAKEGTPPSSDSRSGESKSPDGGSATSEGEPGELGSTSTPEHPICTHSINLRTLNIRGLYFNWFFTWLPPGNLSVLVQKKTQ